MPNTTLAIPFVVKNARLTLVKSLGLTKKCWQDNKPIKMKEPIQQNKPN